MDVTHISFGKSQWVHVSIDIFSVYIYMGSAQKERISHVISYLLEYFTAMGVPEKIKTDNAPTYTSQQLQLFFQQWNICPFTGIPYNPQGQAIVECENGTLKLLLLKQKGENSTPTARLMKALFTLNHL